LLREFKVDKNKVNYRDLIKALEDYPAEATRQSMVYPRNRKYLSNKKRRSSVEGGPKVDDFKDPSQRNRAAIEAIHAKISRKIVNAGDLRLAFEKYDISRRGRITYDFFMMALGQFGLVFEEAEAKQLLIVMDPKGEKSIEYGRFISMVFPPSNMQTARKGPMSFKASLRAMSNMSPADQLRHLQMCVEKALSKGPRELQRMLGIFRLSGDEDINISSLKVMLMDFGLSLTDAQTLALMRQVDPSTKGRISYFKLISGLLPSDCVLEQGMRSGLAVGSTMLHRHRPSQNKLSDADFHHAMLARIKRQLYRKGPSGVPVGHQLRDVLSGLLCRNDVGMQDLRRAFVGVGILMDDSDIERLVNLYRSPAHPSMRLSQLIEDIDDKTFDFVFSTGNVAGSGLQRIQKELPAPNEPDALIRNKLRRVLRRRLEQDGSKSIVTVLRLHDLDRTGRSALSASFCFCTAVYSLTVLTWHRGAISPLRDADALLQ
jgi:Ca2+-binding EF-hand superfamily protein